MVLPFTLVLCGVQRHYELPERPGRNRYPTFVNLLILWGVRIPAAWGLAAVGLGGWAMAGISLSFIAGMIAMLPFYRTHRWQELCEQCERNRDKT